MLAASVLLLFLAGHLFFTQWEFNNRAVTTTGMVKALNPPEIVFQTPSGAAITFKQDGWRSGSHPSQIGESVLVAYLPGMPERAEMSEFIWLAPGIATFWSAALMLFGYLTYIGKMVVGPLKQKRFIIGGE